MHRGLLPRSASALVKIVGSEEGGSLASIVRVQRHRRSAAIGKYNKGAAAAKLHRRSPEVVAGLWRRRREAIAELLMKRTSKFLLGSASGFQECLEILNKSDEVNIIGINYSSPQFIENLIIKFKKLIKKAIAVYPNSGEVWNGKAKRWLPSECFGDGSFALLAKRWHESGC